MTLATADGLQVLGTRLCRADGRRFVIKGIAQYWYTYAAEDGSQDGGIAPVSASYYTNRDTVHTWLASQGVNLIRIGLGSEAYENETYLPKAAYRARLADLVRSATAAGLYVQLQTWEALGAGSSLVDDYVDWHPFWADIAPIILGNPRVIVAPHNEPHDIESADWREVYTGELDFFRGELGYRGVLVLNTRFWSHNVDQGDLATVFTHDAALRGAPALLVGLHEYMDSAPAPGASAGYLAAHKAVLDAYYLANGASKWPVFLDETGNANNGVANGATSDGQSTGFPPGTANYRQWLREFHYSLATDEVPNLGLNGVSAFQLHWVDPNGMVDDLAVPAWNATWGQIYKTSYLDNVATP